MDVTLSKRGDYVMRAAICLARAFADGSSRKIREVVDATDVPRSFASQILSDLVRAGLATSKAGRDGGYRLARAPAQITVLEVVEAAEGPLRLGRCALGDGPCRWQDVCPLHETWSEVAVALRELLASANLEQVAERDAAIESGTYAVPTSSHRANPTAIEVADTVQVELGVPDTHGALARESGHLGTVASTVATGQASLTPVGADGEVHYLLAWRDATAVVPSWVEGRLSVKAVDEDRSELQAVVTWRAEAAAVARLRPGGTDPSQYAKKELRSFLRELARALEHSASTRSHATTPKRA